MTQLALLLGRPLRMPADDDGSYDNEATVYEQIDVYLSPRQATWIGLDAPTVPQCPGCVLFGCCALHDDDDDDTTDDKSAKAAGCNRRPPLTQPRE